MEKRRFRLDGGIFEALGSGVGVGVKCRIAQSSPRPKASAADLLTVGFFRYLIGEVGDEVALGIAVTEPQLFGEER